MGNEGRGLDSQPIARWAGTAARTFRIDGERWEPLGGSLPAIRVLVSVDFSEVSVFIVVGCPQNEQLHSGSRGPLHGCCASPLTL